MNSRTISGKFIRRAVVVGVDYCDCGPDQSCMPPTLVAIDPIEADQGIPFTWTPTAPTYFTGTTPIVWSLDGDSDPLPTGLSLSATTGVISGTPTVPGISNLVLVITNSCGTSLQAFTFTVNP